MSANKLDITATKKKGCLGTKIVLLRYCSDDYAVINNRRGRKWSSNEKLL